MIPLYAVGVFCSFTLSQAGMVVHWFRLKGSSWKRKAVMNGFGAVLTGVVLFVVLVTKFLRGAYIVLVAAIILMLLFSYLERHYRRVASAMRPPSRQYLERAVSPTAPQPHMTVVLFVAGMNEAIARALALGSSYRADRFEAVTVVNDPASFDRVQPQWRRLAIEVPLVPVPGNGGGFVGTAVRYIASLKPATDHTVVVIVPELGVDHWWEAALHNQNALRLKAALLKTPWVVVMNVQLRDDPAAAQVSVHPLQATSGR